MASDTFTCSRCGQMSYYRDGSYLFGQQIICARCYTAQAAPPPVVGAPGATPIPAGPPQAGFAVPITPTPPGQNRCGTLGFVFAIITLALYMMGKVMSADVESQISPPKQGEDIKAMIERFQQESQSKVVPYLKSHPVALVGLILSACGAPVFVLVGLVLSIIGVCRANSRKGLAIAGLVLNALFIITPCCILPILQLGLGKVQ